MLFEKNEKMNKQKTLLDNRQPFMNRVGFSPPDCRVCTARLSSPKPAHHKHLDSCFKRYKTWPELAEALSDVE